MASQHYSKPLQQIFGQYLRAFINHQCKLHAIHESTEEGAEKTEQADKNHNFIEPLTPRTGILKGLK